MIELSKKQKKSILDPERYEKQLSAFDLTDDEKQDLIYTLYVLIKEVIEMNKGAVDNSSKAVLDKDFKQ